MKFTFTDGHEEITRRARPTTRRRATAHLYAGSEVVEFSPTTELQQTMEVVEKNMASLGA